MNQTAITIIGLLAVLGFVIWLVLFTGDGYRGIIDDIKALKGNKKERFPVPVFDRSKIDLPRPEKPKPRAISRDSKIPPAEQLAQWALDLQRSIEDIREEASALARAYRDLPPQFAALATEPPKRAKAVTKAKAKGKPSTAKKKPLKTAKKRATPKTKRATGGQPRKRVSK
jgi:hypothetical protein